MIKNINRFIFAHSLRQQIKLVILTLLSFPPLYLMLEIPKEIVNGALTDVDAMKTIFSLKFDAVGYLAFLCGCFLGLVILNGLLKMNINTLKGIIAERLVRRLRFEMINILTSLPLSRFNKMSQGEINALVINETEPLAGYMGDVIVQPLFQGGTMLTILIFMFVQNFWLGLASVILIPLQAYIIPKLQRQINLLKKQRVYSIRRLSVLVGEFVEGNVDVRVNGTQEYHLAVFSDRFYKLFKIRLNIFKKKFMMKFINNFINQLTPFFFFLIGGYLVIIGELSIGALVAAIAAYKDLVPPWKALLNHYQNQQDAHIRYQQIIEFFSYKNGNGKDSEKIAKSHDVPPNFNINVESICTYDGKNQTVLDDISLSIRQGTLTAVVGGTPYARDHLAEVIAGVRIPDKGCIDIGGTNIKSISRHVLTSIMSYHTASPYIFNTSMYNNVIYSLYKSPPGILKDNALKEAIMTGNSSYDVSKDWINYWDIGYRDKDDFFNWYLKGAKTVGGYETMYERGLLETFDPQQRPNFAADLIKARSIVRRKIEEENLDQYISFFNKSAYSENLSIGENVMFSKFSIPSDSNRFIEQLGLKPFLLNSRLFNNGTQEGIKYIAQLLTRYAIDTEKVNILEEHQLTEQDILMLKSIWHKATTKSVSILSNEQQWRVFSLWLQFIPGSSKNYKIPKDMEALILDVRNDLLLHHFESLNTLNRFLKEDRYNKGLTIRDNLLFGKYVDNIDRDTKLKIEKMIRKTLYDLNITSKIQFLLAESKTGIAGSLIPLQGKQRLPLARALLKKPNILVINEGLNSFIKNTQAQMIKNIQTLLPGITIIWFEQSHPKSIQFDNVIDLSPD